MNRLYILPFFNDQLIAKLKDGKVKNTDDSLRFIQIPLPEGNINDAVKVKLAEYGIIVDVNRVRDCGILETNTRYVVYKINALPVHPRLIPHTFGRNKSFFSAPSQRIFDGENLVDKIKTCKNNAPNPPNPPNPPSDDDSNINIIIRRPFWPPILGPFSPYGFWPYSPTVRISTPYSSPIVRIPFFSLPRPDFGFVPAVVPTVTQPVLSPVMENPFRRFSEPSPMNIHLFNEKVRPVHLRSKRLGMNGGYYEKYLKYKNKYLELKNQLENQV
jgi:hypothetical protein